MYDLNVSCTEKNENELKEIISMAIKLEYDGIALNRIVNGNLTQDDVNALKGVNLDLLSNDYVGNLRLQSSGKSFRQLKRITVSVDEQSQLQALNPGNPLLSEIDVVAICPSDEKIFHQSLINNPNYDLVTFDLTKRLPFVLKRHTVSLALQQEINFEISFGGLISNNNNSRRFVISNALTIVRATRGKNIIFTSGATDMMELRGPYDIANLGKTFLDIDMAKSKDCLSKQVIKVLKRGETRRSYRGVFSEIDIKSLQEEEKWKIPPTSDDLEIDMN